MHAADCQQRARGSCWAASGSRHKCQTALSLLLQAAGGQGCLCTCPCRLSLLGGLKVGRKKLFIRSETGAYKELQPLCVLDFYVADSYQRMGLGKHIFEVSTCSSL